jgi:hypothetical protein
MENEVPLSGEQDLPLYDELRFGFFSFKLSHEGIVAFFAI